MDQLRHEIGESHMYALMDAAYDALILLERISAPAPELDRAPDLQSEIDQARESLREAIREFRLAGAAQPNVQELDFVLPEVDRIASGPRQSKPVRTA